MFGYIILRNAHKYEARIDLCSYKIKGGFRGFRLVPSGIHYVSLQSLSSDEGFWCYLQPNEVVVKFFNQNTQQFEDDERENTVHYQQLASRGAMDETLLAYDHTMWGHWWLLTNQIEPAHFSIMLSSQKLSSLPINLSTEPINTQRHFHQKLSFEQMLLGIYQGNSTAFLTEFQFAFARWFVSEAEHNDTAAFNHWRYCLEIVCNTGKSSICKAPDFFLTLTSILITQLDYIDDSLLHSEKSLIWKIRQLADEMVNSGYESLIKKGHELKTYLNKNIYPDK